MSDLVKMIRECENAQFYNGAHGEIDLPDEPETAGPFVAGNWYNGVIKAFREANPNFPD